MTFEVCARPRNAAATRAAILDAASRRFMSEPYEQVGMRDVAGDVGVDAALISRYFGSKEDLFLAVLDGCGKESDLMDGPRSEFGRRMAHDLVYGQPNESKMGWLLIMLRSASSPKAASILKRSSDNFHAPFTEWVGGENAGVRARLLTGVMMGLGVSRDITGGFDFSAAECETMHDWLAETLQSLIDGQ